MVTKESFESARSELRDFRESKERIERITKRSKSLKSEKKACGQPPEQWIDVTRAYHSPAISKSAESNTSPGD